MGDLPRSVDAALDAWTDTLSVSIWPLWARRTFVLLLPVSAPLWLANFIILLAVALTLTGLFSARGFMRSVGAAILSLWSNDNA